MYEQQQSYSSHQQDNIRPQSHSSQHPSHPQQNRNNGRLAQEEASIKKAAAETKYFWNLVAKNNQRKQQNLSDGNYEISDDKKLQNKKRTEMQLFGSSADTHDIPQGVFQDIPLGVIPDVDETDNEEKDPVVVERSGAGEESVPTLENFDELKDDSKFEIPSFIIDNIALMKYEYPTPIQKHSIPLGIAGYDLMCCAQTVRNNLITCHTFS